MTPDALRGVPGRAERTPPSRRLLIVTCVIWATLVTGWLGALLVYESTPADAALRPAETWPDELPFARNEGGPTWVLALHPRCPCSNATLEELNRALTECPASLKGHVLVYRPADANGDWTQTRLWRYAESLPDVTMHIDPEGALARRFGVSTSGHVLLFDRAGKLAYEGGLTASRGHVGQNHGREALVASWAELEPEPERRTFPVFGCPITNENECAE